MSSNAGRSLPAQLAPIGRVDILPGQEPNRTTESSKATTDCNEEQGVSYKILHSAVLYSGLWALIIRPPRSSYTISDLGPPRFRLPRDLNGPIYARRDIQLESSSGVYLECSHFMPILNKTDATRPCVVYLHGSSASRLDALAPLPFVLERGMTMFCFDFSGSGLSGGDYVTLGYNEEKDLRTVLRYLRSLRYVSQIAIWGRSMGAVTAVFRLAEDQGVCASVLETPFSNFIQLATETLDRGGIPLPSWVKEGILSAVCDEVQKRANFDPRVLKPVLWAPKVKCPALFGIASDDELVSHQQSRELVDAWGGPTQLLVFEGAHSAPRPDWWRSNAADFLRLNFMLVSDRQSQLGDDAHLSNVPSMPFGETSRTGVCVDKLLLGACLDSFAKRTNGLDDDSTPPVVHVAQVPDTEQRAAQLRIDLVSQAVDVFMVNGDL